MFGNVYRFPGCFIGSTPEGPLRYPPPGVTIGFTLDLSAHKVRFNRIAILQRGDDPQFDGFRPFPRGAGEAGSVPADIN